MLKDGVYKAKLLEAGLGDKNGEAQPYMKFEVYGETTETLMWYGSLKSEKAAEVAVKGLVAAGFVGNEFGDLAKPMELVFAPKDNITVTIANETYQNKTTCKIKFVNSGVKKFQGQAPKGTALFAKVRQEQGIKKAAPTGVSQMHGVPNFAPQAAIPKASGDDGWGL